MSNNFRRSGKSKYATAPENPREVSKKINQLDSTRDSLTEELLEYRGFLKDKTLNSNKTEMEKKHINDTMAQIQDLAMQLEMQNVGEGTMTLSIAALRSILIMHNELNTVTWRLYSLFEKVDNLQKSIDALTPQEEETEENE